MINKILTMTKVFFALCAFFILSSSFAQCDAKGLKSKCTSQLASGFTYIKSYPLEEGKVNSKGEIEYSFVFSKGTIYMLTFANSNGASSGIEITLFDPAHKKIASNFDLGSGDFFPLGYKCTSTGVHYMTFKFKQNIQTCGLSILGFKRG
jgi:hypothetical protein